MMQTEQSLRSQASGSAAETVQYRAMLAGSEPAASRPAPQHPPAAWLLPGSPPPVAVDLQAASDKSSSDEHTPTSKQLLTSML